MTPSKTPPPPVERRKPDPRIDALVVASELAQQDRAHIRELLGLLGERLAERIDALDEKMDRLLGVPAQAGGLQLRWIALVLVISILSSGGVPFVLEGLGLRLGVGQAAPPPTEAPVLEDDEDGAGDMVDSATQVDL